MPELPEVETVKRQLTKYLIGHTIQKVKIRYKKCFEGRRSSVVGGRIKNIRRFGKAQSIDLNNGYSLVVHIKLTGQLIYRGPNLAKTPKLSKKVLDGLGGKHTHVIFYLDRGALLYYNDVRKFGWIKVIKTKDVEKLKFIKNLGPEPFSGGSVKKLTPSEFKEIVSSTKRSIKTLLMDQSKISGVGNIYANDALWLSKIHPSRKSSNLNSREIKDLFNAIIIVLKDGLKHHGASENSFVTPDGMEGMYQQHFLAYGREGSICPRCKKSKYKKIKISGRGTVFCPECQKK